jgi:hypothetical protein
VVVTILTDDKRSPGIKERLEKFCANEAQLAAARDFVAQFKEGQILGWHKCRRGRVVLVLEDNRYRGTDVKASDEVIKILDRENVPRFKGRRSPAPAQDAEEKTPLPGGSS